MIEWHVMRPSRRSVLGVALGATAALLSGCWSPESVTRNIRVIVQAEVAGKVVEGSAVMSLRWQAGDNTRMYIASNAEAVVLELPGRGTVYVLNMTIGDDGRSNISYWPIQVMRSFGIKGNGSLKDFPKLEALEGRYPVQVRNDRYGPKQMPLMVAFTDETKRETIFEVKPDDFPAVFGADVRYVGMWFEFTEDDATDYILKRMPIGVNPNDSYYASFSGRGADGRPISSQDYPFTHKISHKAFYKRGF